MKKVAQKLKVVSLFSGCGGGDLGLLGGFDFLGKRYNKLGFEVVWANDIESHAVETYKKNLGDHIICADITKIRSKDIPEHDLLIGGFPCQSFSMVGERKGFNDPRGLLYREMLRILKDKQPTAFIGENVKGLVSAHGGEAIKQITSDFANAGYDVTYKVLNASHFGVPQKRERVLIVGIRKDQNKTFFYPEPIDGTIPLQTVMEDHREVSEKYYFSKRALAGLKRANKAFNKGRAQDPNAPCNTISTHLSKVSLNGTDPVLLVKSDCYRRLTPREAARIQSFPDTFEFVGSDGKQYIQIGNAIPPVLMWYVAKAIKGQIFKKNSVNQTKVQRSSIKKETQKSSIRTPTIFIPA